jgi:Transmembrane secretion effector
VVPIDELASANALRSLSLQFAGIIGPAIAGWIIAQGGTGLAFGCDALSFILSRLNLR